MRIAVLDDYQKVARTFGPWQRLAGHADTWPLPSGRAIPSPPRGLRGPRPRSLHLPSECIEDEKRQEEMEREAMALQKAFERVFRMVEEHMAREDYMLPVASVNK